MLIKKPAPQKAGFFVVGILTETEVDIIFAEY